jgi:hypothetical protein
MKAAAEVGVGDGLLGMIRNPSLVCLDTLNKRLAEYVA